MKLDERWDVRPEKVAALRALIARWGIDLEQVHEQFVRGGGRGGQKINKTSSCVVLRYPPLELVVRCQDERRRSVNRFLALRNLVEMAVLRLAPEGHPERARIQAERRSRGKKRAGRKKKASRGS